MAPSSRSSLTKRATTRAKRGLAPAGKARDGVAAKVHVDEGKDPVVVVDDSVSPEDEKCCSDVSSSTNKRQKLTADTASVAPSASSMSIVTRGTLSSSSSSSSASSRASQPSPEVREILRHLRQNPDNAEDDEKHEWRTALDSHFTTPGFARLARFVAQERGTSSSKPPIYPPEAETWTALNTTPLDKVKVVIVGQDPYHGPGQAHGLCFSVKRGQAIPPSLRNIYQELREDPKIKFPGHKSSPNHGYLIHWAQQGVLMLNAVMTVRKGQPNSHKNKGWEQATDAILRAVVKNVAGKSNLEKTEEGGGNNGSGIVFLLWGKPAATKAQAVLSSASKKNIFVITTSHPSPLGARKTNQPFLGSRCFSRCNDALVQMGHEPIDWNVD